MFSNDRSSTEVSPTRARAINAAAGRLYRRYGGSIYARCRRLLRDAAAAEDATQEVFIRALERLGHTMTEAEAVGWLHRVATNYCLNQLRDQRRQAVPMAEMPERWGDDLEEVLHARVVAQRLLDIASRDLSVPARMYYLHGVDQGAVAQTLGVSRRTVINRLNAFNESSRRYLEEAPADVH